jgi:hypothetical protein
MEKNGTIIATNTLGYSGEKVEDYGNSTVIHI